MTVPTEEILGCRVANDRLHTTVATLTDERLRSASRLPDWSVAHVLAHLVGNGDSVVRRLEGARQGTLVEQYPGGPEARNTFISELAGGSLADIAERTQAVDDRIIELFDTVDPDVWGVPVAAGGGGQMLAGDLPFHRWREIEVHLVDLGMGHEPADWPPDLLERWLPSLISGLRPRSEPTALMAWLLGRADAPRLEPWG